MRTTLKFAAVLLLCSLFPQTARAAESGWYVTPFGGYTWFDPDFDFKEAVYGGGRLGVNLNHVFGLQLSGGYSPTQWDVPDGPDVTFWNGALDLVVTPIRLNRFDAYLFGGGGYSSTEWDSGGTIDSDDFKKGTFEHGAGVHIWFGDRVALNLEARNILLLAEGNLLASNKNNFVAGGGLTFAFGGKAKDADGDGVADRKDKCPDTPAGATVDATGCPMDGDGDKVFDGIDKCPGTPAGASVDASGCPTDGDGDGVFDGLDQCADTPKGATVDAKGCPADADGDGVFDGLDQCASTPKGATVDAKGCPMDSDGDGIVDGLDKCPNTGAGLKVDQEGCPIEVTERETELLDTGMIRLQDVNFETGKSDILPESYATLDVVGQVLGKWPELRIEIGGHTDSRGSNELNQKLSEARAQSVLDYLKQKFPNLQAEQFTVKGYGESKPIAPNNNALNMAKNRRVEFVVLNKDVLKREVEKRRMVPKGGE